MLILYSLILSLVLLLGTPWWLFRMATSGKYRQGLTERLGLVPPRIRSTLPGHPSVVWLHAVSVGEVLAASRLIDELRRALAARDPGQNWRVLVSTTTRTGQTLARERFGAENVFYFPLDFAFAVRSWLRTLRPRLVILVETEFWPRMLVECRRAYIPVVVVNARISDRSWPRYRRLARLWKPLLGGLTATLAQSPLDAERLRALGAANTSVAGNLKYDIRTAAPAAVTMLLRQHLPASASVLVCGSTLPGEEALLLPAIPAGTVTILAPRHPERFDEVAQLLRRRGTPWLRRSQWAQAPAPIAPGAVILLDSIGELASVYSLADAAFVGGSLIPAGGHNPLEPAQFSVPILMGPHYQNFRGIVELLRQREAIRIAEPAKLSDALPELLARTPENQAMAARAHHVFESESGATVRALQTLLQILESRP